MMPLLKTIPIILRRQPRERRAALQALLFLLLFKAAAKTLPARTLLALGKSKSSITASRHSLSPLPYEAALAIHAITEASCLLKVENCLVRALALRMLLGREGIPSELHIGARKDEQGEFAAHAWLTCEKTVLIGGHDSPGLYHEIVSSVHPLLQ